MSMACRNLPVFEAQALAGVERVELLKGPQGTLYGKSALGGVLNVRPRQAYADARVRGEYRNYHMHRYGISLAAQGQYDGRDWRLTATAGNQRVRFERRFPIGAYHSSQPEHWQQNMQELRWATRGDGQAGSGRRWDAVLGLYRQRAQQQRSSQFTLATVPASMPATHSTGVSQTLAAYGGLWRPHMARNAAHGRRRGAAPFAR